MDTEITKAGFDPYLNEIFEICFDNGERVELTLTESTEQKKNGQDVFWFIFEGSAEKALPQGTYRLAHPKLGEALLFLVPVGGGKDGVMSYQSLFNKMVDKPVDETKD